MGQRLTDADAAFPASSLSINTLFTLSLSSNFPWPFPPLWKPILQAQPFILFPEIGALARGLEEEILQNVEFLGEGGTAEKVLGVVGFNQIRRIAPDW